MPDRSFTVEARDGTRLRVCEFRAAGAGPVLVGLHGIASHAGWYGDLARALAADGVHCYLTDRRGSGLSGGPRGHMDRWQDVADDVAAVVAAARERTGARAVHSLGVSLGGVFALAAELRHPGLFARHAILSPGFRAAMRVPLRQRIEVLVRAAATPLRPMELPFALEQFTERLDWQQALGGDPLRTRAVTARFLFETFRMQGHVARHAPRLRAPVLALLAGADGMVDNARAIEVLGRAGSARVRVETFAGASHVLAAAVPRPELVARIDSWIRGETLPEGQRFETRRTEREAWGEVEPPAPPRLGPEQP